MRLHTKVWQIKLDVAKDFEVGLLGRDKLKQYEGMILLFPHQGFWPIHTMGLDYPIDVIWLDRNNMVVDMVTLTPDTPGVMNDLPADKAIELNAGMAKLSGIRVGEHLTLSNSK